MVKMQGGVFGAVATSPRLIWRRCHERARRTVTGAVRAPSLETVGMTKIFGPLTALDDVSIKVEAGSFHALLGENGAGKSTLVKCIMGFYQPTAARCCSTAGGARSAPRCARWPASAWSTSISRWCPA
jgi:ABC-type transport system involved in cytochrome bd biosynthesis fused ATPase/permease subunit